MKATLTNSLILFLVLLTGTVVAQQNKNHTLENHREEIQKVIKTEDTGVVRGYDFGTTLDHIKKTETGEYVADGRDFAIYKVPVNEKEYAEIIYYLDEEQKVKGIGVEFIITEENFKLEENIVLDFQAYFTERFGKYKINELNDEVWESPDGYFIEMGDASEGGSVLEIEIEFYKK